MLTKAAKSNNSYILTYFLGWEASVLILVARFALTAFAQIDESMGGGAADISTEIDLL